MAVTPVNTLKNWFKTGIKPTQAQFWAWLDSFWHKSENIPSAQIEGLQELLDTKVDKKDIVQQKGVFDPARPYVFDAELAEYVSYINESSADEFFRVERWFRLLSDTTAGQSPETAPDKWRHIGTTLGEIAIEDVVGLREELDEIQDLVSTKLESFYFEDLDPEFAYGVIAMPYSFRVVDKIDFGGVSTLITRKEVSGNYAVFGSGVGVDFPPISYAYSNVQQFDIDVSIILNDIQSSYRPICMIHCGNTNNGFYIIITSVRNGADTHGLSVMSTGIINSPSSPVGQLLMETPYDLNIKMCFLTGDLIITINENTTVLGAHVSIGLNPSMNPVYYNYLGFSLGNSGISGFLPGFNGAVKRAALSINNVLFLDLAAMNLNVNRASGFNNGILTGVLTEGPSYTYTSDSEYEGEVISPFSEVRIYANTTKMQTHIKLQNE